MSGTQPAATDRWVDARARPAAAAGLTEVGRQLFPERALPPEPGAGARRRPRAARRRVRGARARPGPRAAAWGEVGVVSLLPLVL